MASNDSGNLAVQVADLRSDVQHARKDIGDIQVQVADLRSDVQQVQKDIGDVKVQVAELRSDVRHAQKDISDIKVDVRELKTELRDSNERTDKRFDEIKDSLAAAKIWAFGLYVALGGTLLYVVARSAKWL